jgi:hypothetical protein
MGRRIIMWKKLIIISICISVLFVFSASISSVNAKSKNLKVNWQIVGTIVDLIPLYSPSDGSFAGVHSLLNLSAQGPPGPAKITLLSRFDGTTSTYTDCTPTLFFDKNDGVIIFPDNSFLYISINKDEFGIICPDGSYHVTANIDGGTGFYAGASGTLYSEGYTKGATDDGTISSLIGKITGTIEFSH